MMTANEMGSEGIVIIATERERQIMSEGYSSEHDDKLSVRTPGRSNKGMERAAVEVASGVQA